MLDIIKDVSKNDINLLNDSDLKILQSLQKQKNEIEVEFLNSSFSSSHVFSGGRKIKRYSAEYINDYDYIINKIIENRCEYNVIFKSLDEIIKSIGYVIIKYSIIYDEIELMDNKDYHNNKYQLFIFCGDLKNILYKLKSLQDKEGYELSNSRLKNLIDIDYIFSNDIQYSSDNFCVFSNGCETEEDLFMIKEILKVPLSERTQSQKDFMFKSQIKSVVFFQDNRPNNTDTLIDDIKEMVKTNEDLKNTFDDAKWSEDFINFRNQFKSIELALSNIPINQDLLFTKEDLF